MEGRTLARARGPVQCDEFARLDPQIEAAQRDSLGRSGAKNPEDVVQLERAEGEFLANIRLAVEAPQLQRKLSIISRYASTLSTPCGVPRSTTARRPPFQR